MNRMTRITRRSLVAAVTTAALVVPAAAYAAHSFTDVSSTAYYHAAVEWAKAKGVTSGCNPAQGNTRFCPEDNVTRGQMAVFLNNLDSKDVFLTPTEKAADSDKLDGLDSTDLLPRFAVIRYASPSSVEVMSHRGLTSATRVDMGDYDLVWDDDISDCAWTATYMSQNGGIQGGSRVVTLNGGGSFGDNSFRVKTKYGDTGADVDASFAVTITC